MDSLYKIDIKCPITKSIILTKDVPEFLQQFGDSFLSIEVKRKWTLPSSPNVLVLQWMSSSWKTLSLFAIHRFTLYPPYFLFSESYKISDTR